MNPGFGNHKERLFWGSFPHSLWFPLRGPKTGFIPSFPEHQQGFSSGIPRDNSLPRLSRNFLLAVVMACYRLTFSFGSCFMLASCRFPLPPCVLISGFIVALVSLCWGCLQKQTVPFVVFFQFLCFFFWGGGGEGLVGLVRVSITPI